MLRSYLKLAWKVLLRRKFFTFASLFGVAFTLVVLTVGATFFDHVFGPHPPESRLGRTLGLYGLAMVGHDSTRTGFAGWPFIEQHVRDLPGAQDVGVFELQSSVDSYLGTQKVSSWLKRTDGGFWRILDFQFVEGQPFTDDDLRQQRSVAVINESTRRRFFGPGAALGRSIDIDGQRFRVVGVVRDVPLLRFVPFADVWVPITTQRNDGYRREEVADYVALVLAPPGRMESLRREFDHRVAAARPRDTRLFDRFYGGLETPFEFVSRLLLSPQLEAAHPARLRGILAAVVLFFMALPAINLVNLNLSRILERSGEIGVRKSFGASVHTLLGQFVVENLVLSLLGGAVAVALSAVVLWALDTAAVVPYTHLTLNLRVLGWGVLFATAFGLLSGVYPAWRMSRLDPVESLRGSSR